MDASLSASLLKAERDNAVSDDLRLERIGLREFLSCRLVIWQDVFLGPYVYEGHILRSYPGQ